MTHKGKFGKQPALIAGGPYEFTWACNSTSSHSEIRNTGWFKQFNRCTRFKP